MQHDLIFGTFKGGKADAKVEVPAPPASIAELSAGGPIASKLSGSRQPASKVQNSELMSDSIDALS
jgi:hypothetical protein